MLMMNLNNFYSSKSSLCHLQSKQSYFHKSKRKQILLSSNYPCRLWQVRLTGASFTSTFFDVVRKLASKKLQLKIASTKFLFKTKFCHCSCSRRINRRRQEQAEKHDLVTFDNNFLFQIQHLSSIIFKSSKER